MQRVIDAGDDRVVGQRKVLLDGNYPLALAAVALSVYIDRRV